MYTILTLIGLMFLSGCGTSESYPQRGGDRAQTRSDDRQTTDTTMNENNQMQYEKAMFGAGCFWGVEHKFRGVEGVVETAVGYSGGNVENPTYQQVCSDTTGHAEVVLVNYDPKKVSYKRLVELFFDLHNPTQLNRQGPDVGRQYRSAVFYHNEDQKRVAEQAKAALAESGKYSKPIVTEISPAKPFWRAEEYHQRYLEKRGVESCGQP